MNRATTEPKTVPSFSQNGISENGINRTRKDLYEWEKRAFPVSEGYKKQLDKNGIYHPVHVPGQDMFRVWKDDPKHIEDYLKNLPDDNWRAVKPIDSEYFKQFEMQPLGGTAATEAKILEMVPLKEKTSVRQKLQKMLSAIGNYLNEHIRFGTQLDGKAIRVPEGP